jgi:hypothetical protein
VLEYGRQLDLPDQIPPAKPAPVREEARPLEPIRREPAPAPVMTAAPPVATPAASPQSSTVVVPITFPPAGQTGEIVIRIVLKPAA